MQITDDSFLGGALHILQPRYGYRAAMDAIFLAAFVPARAGDSVLDVGCGVGVASLCLGYRVEGLHLSAIDLQAKYTNLAMENQCRNAIDIEVYCSDIRKLNVNIRFCSFDHVISNPPFYQSGIDSIKPNDKAIAKCETFPLSQWIKLCLRRVKPRGYCSIIHRSDRLAEILSAFSVCGEIVILPLVSYFGDDANRVLVRARKGSRTPLRLCSSFVVHSRKQGKTNNYTDAAQQILRHGIGFT